jgi:macrolide-specific efflux system membrane fusion protein
VTFQAGSEQNPKILRGRTATVSGMPARLSLRRPSVAVNAVLAVLLAAGAFWAYRTISGPATPTAADAATRTVPVRQGTVTASVTADGSVASASTAAASFVTGGTVTAIDVHVGQKVKKGQTLAKVDPAAAQRSLAEARANLTAAGDALDRARTAGSDTSGAEDQVSQARLAVDDAQAAVDGTTLTAPMAGTVVAVNGTLGSSSSGSGSSTSGSGSAGGGSGNGGGQNAGTGQNSGTGQNTGTGSSGSSSATASSSSAGFIDLADLSKLQVTANFAEADATRLKDGQAATITWNALSGTAETGRVAAIDPQATTSDNVVTYGVTLSLDTVPSGAKPGQTVSVSVVTGTAQNALFVNSAAVTSIGNRHTVTVETNGQRQIVPVEIGLQGDSTTQITAGLQAGQEVAVPLASSTSGSGTGFGPAGGRFGGAGGPLGGGAAPAGGGTFGGGTRTGGGAGPGGGR